MDMQAIGVGAAALQAANEARTMQRTGGLSVVSRRSANYGAGSNAMTAETFAGSTRVRHTNKTGKPLVGLALVYAHWAPAGGTESNTAQDWLVKSSIETVNGDETLRERVSIAGQHPAKVAVRCVAIGDEIAAYVPVGGYVMERTAMTTTGASGSVYRHQLALGGTSGFGQNTGEGAEASGDKVMGTAAMTQNTSAAPSAILLLGRTADGTIARSGLVWSDSTGAATDDPVLGTGGAGGYLNRALVDWPGNNVSIGGERGDQAGNVATSYTRRKIARLHTDIFDGFYINDINQAIAQGFTVASIKAAVLVRAFWAMAQGINFHKGTCTPMLASSTDGYFDPANSTLHAQALTYRVPLNQWTRDTGPTGFVAQANAQVAGIPGAGFASFYDPCTAIEVNQANVPTQDGGYYKGAEGGTIYDSGTATSGTTTAATDTTKTWTTNQHAGKVLHITGGPGAGEAHSIQTNTATTITTGLAFSTAITSASTYRIVDTNCVDGIHQSTGGHTRIAASIKPGIDAVMTA